MDWRQPIPWQTFMQSHDDANNNDIKDVATPLSSKQPSVVSPNASDASSNASIASLKQEVDEGISLVTSLTDFMNHGIQEGVLDHEDENVIQNEINVLKKQCDSHRQQVQELVETIEKRRTFLKSYEAKLKEVPTLVKYLFEKQQGLDALLDELGM